MPNLAINVAFIQEINLPNYSIKIDQNKLYTLREKSRLSQQGFYLPLIEVTSYKDKIKDLGRAQ